MKSIPKDQLKQIIGEKGLSVTRGKALKRDIKKTDTPPQIIKVSDEKHITLCGGGPDEFPDTRC